jgi:CCR4-NOT transcription complex subunit 2
MHPPSLKLEHLSKFTLETLFYMFYAIPRDILQASAAQELYRREWRYQSEFRVWMRARTPAELLHSHPNVPYIYYDINACEIRLFTSPTRVPVTQGFLSGMLNIIYVFLLHCFSVT